MKYIIYVVCIGMDCPRKRLCLTLIRSVVGKRLYRILLDYDVLIYIYISIICSYMKYIIYVVCIGM